MKSRRTVNGISFLLVATLSVGLTMTASSNAFGYAEEPALFNSNDVSVKCDGADRRYILYKNQDTIFQDSGRGGPVGSCEDWKANMNAIILRARASGNKVQLTESGGYLKISAYNNALSYEELQKENALLKSQLQSCKATAGTADKAVSTKTQKNIGSSVPSSSSRSDGSNAGAGEFK